MPAFIFGGYTAFTYPEGRDLAGANLGTVEPGDIRDLDAAPDQWWREATDDDRAARSAGADPGEADPGEAGAGEGAGSGPVPSPAPAPVPVPAT